MNKKIALKITHMLLVCSGGQHYKWKEKQHLIYSPSDALFNIILAISKTASIGEVYQTSIQIPAKLVLLKLFVNGVRTMERETVFDILSY